MALAAFLRFWDLDRVGLRGDEAVYAGQAAVLAGAKGFGPYFILQSRGDSNFLLFQGLVSVVYRVAGAGDVTARSVAAAFSVLTVAVVYGIGATLFGRRTGLFSALLLSVGGYSVMLGRLALLDSTLTFLFATAMLCAAKWTATRRSGWLYGFAATAALTVQAKIVGGLALLVVATYLLISRSTGELNWRRMLICAGVFLAALTPMTAFAVWPPPKAEGEELAVWQAMANTIARENEAKPYKLWYAESDFTSQTCVPSCANVDCPSGKQATC